MIKERVEKFVKNLCLSNRLHFSVFLSKQSQVRFLHFFHFGQFFTWVIFYILFQRNRTYAYRKRGCLFECKANQGPYKIMLVETDQWPSVTKLRVQMTPNESLDYSQNGNHSLWTFLASTANNGMSYDHNLSLAFNCLGMRFCQSDYKEVYEVFRVGVLIELWVRSTETCNKIATLIRPKYRKTVVLRHYADNEEELKNNYNYCSKQNDYMRSSIEPKDAQFTCSLETVYFCDFPDCNCFYLEEHLLNRHKLTCVNREDFCPTVTYKSVQMSEYKPGEDLLHALGLRHIVEQFLTFDIETLCEAPTNPLNKRNQTLVSISVKKSWEPKSVCFTRTNSDSGSGYELVERFISHLDEAHFEFRNRFADFQRIRNRIDQFANRWGINKSYEVQAALNQIDDMERLKCIGFNSERFDVPELYPYLCLYFGAKGITFDVIKRGNGM